MSQGKAAIDMGSPRYTSSEIREHLDNLSRGPFREVMARFLDCAPSDSAIAEQAEKHPDRWAQSAAIIARLSGYTEKLEVEGSIVHKISDLSDSALLERIKALATQVENGPDLGNG